MPLEQRLKAAVKLPGAQGAFLRDHLADAAHYTLTLASTLAYDIVAIDRAMEWGYGWEAGPFQVMDALGLDWLREQFKADGKDINRIAREALGQG